MLILDWRPFEQYTTNATTPLGITFNSTFKLEPTKDGARLIYLWGKPQGAWLFCKMNDLVSKLILGPQTDKWAEQLRQRIQQDIADGTAFISPPIEFDKAQLASLATQTLTHDH